MEGELLFSALAALCKVQLSPALEKHESCFGGLPWLHGDRWRSRCGTCVRTMVHSISSFNCDRELSRLCSGMIIHSTLK
jgi:hypothetical protein